jgi:basic membrane lipoprotein Med (substrate-binding protein (PBP1-ABC) superfamily)
MGRRSGIPAAVGLAILAVLSPTVAGAQEADPAATPLPDPWPKARIAVYTNGLDDPSVNAAIVAAVEAAAADLGTTRDPIVADPMTPEEMTRAVRSQVEEGLDIVVLSGSDQAATLRTALQYLETFFIDLGQAPPCVDAEGSPDPTGACEGDPTQYWPNYVAVSFARDQAAYLAGIVAASASRNDRLGIITSTPACDVCRRYAEGFELGARSVKPDIAIETATLTDADSDAIVRDAGIGKVFTSAFIDVLQPDVLLPLSQAGSEEMLEAACEAGILAVGTDIDRAVARPDLSGCLITSATIDLAGAARENILTVSRGRFATSLDEGFQPGSQRWDASRDAVGASPAYSLDPSLPVDVPARLEDAMAALRAGQLETCPTACEGDVLEPSPSPSPSPEASADNG